MSSTALPPEVASLLTALEAAFVDVPCGTITLHEAEVIDDYGTAEKREQARRLDPELDWRDVPDASLEACLNALPHLDPTGWRFYLPAFLRLSLRRWGEPRSRIDRVIYTLALGGERELNDYKRARFETLDAAQSTVITQFLELAAKHDEECDALVAEQALDRYWRRA